MNAFLLGAIPLLSGASVFLIRFLFLSPYFVHKEHKAQSDGKIQALEQQLSRYLDTDRKRRDENARNVLDRASGLLKEAKYPTSFQSLYPAGAADLETNEQLIWVCDKLAEHHQHPFEGIDDCVLKDEWLAFLQWGKYHATLKFDALDYVDGAAMWASDRGRTAHPSLPLALAAEMRRK